MATIRPAVERIPGIWEKSEEEAVYDAVLQFAGDLLPGGFVGTEY
jgi:hypothetical protein